MSQEQDKAFFRNYSIVIGILIVMIALFIVFARIVTPDDKTAAEQRQAQVAERTAPVGEVSVAGEAEAEAPATEAPVAAAGKSGEEVYNGLCGACHNVPGIGAPVVGNADEWAPRIAKGIDVLYNNAINGFTGEQGFMMPPRGGGNFTDAEVKAAVDHMVANSQ